MMFALTTLSPLSSDACGHDYFVTSLCDDVTSFEEDLAVTVADSDVSLLQTFSDSQDSSLLEEDISDLRPAGASTKWSNLCCPAETVDDGYTSLANDDDSSSQFSGASSTRDSVVSEDGSTNVPELNVSSVQQSVSFPRGSDIYDDNVFCIALESDHTSAPFSSISLDNSLIPGISDDEVGRGQHIAGPTFDRVTGGQSHRVDFRVVRPHTVPLVNGPEYLNLQTVQEQLQTKTKPRLRTAVNMHPYRPVESHGRQHIPTPKWTSHEFVSVSASVSATPAVCNLSLSALEYIERRRVRLSYFLQRFTTGM